jgi:hypothetical protein
MAAGQRRGSIYVLGGGGHLNWPQWLMSLL